jgi:hypothetical protein
MLETGRNKEELKKERGLKYSNSSMDFLLGGKEKNDCNIIYLYGQVRASGSLKIFLTKYGYHFWKVIYLGKKSGNDSFQTYGQFHQK